MLLHEASGNVICKTYMQNIHRHMLNLGNGNEGLACCLCSSFPRDCHFNHSSVQTVTISGIVIFFLVLIVRPMGYDLHFSVSLSPSEFLHMKNLILLTSHILFCMS